MQVGQPSAAKEAWYDRGMVVKPFGLSAQLTAAAITVRLIYTIPANKIARVSFSPMTIMPISPGMGFGDIMGRYTVLPSGGSTVSIATLYKHSPAAGDLLVLPPPGDIWLNAGDVVRMDTTDVGMDSSSWWGAGYTVHEFDA